LLSTIKEFFATKKTSYILYITSTAILFIPSVILFFTNPQYFKLYSDFVIKYFLIPAYSIGFILDMFSVIKSLWKTFIGKIIYSIFGYFAFTFSQSLAKQSIYYITNENPDFYQTSIQFLSAMYLIPSWIIYVNYAISIIMVMSTLALLLIMPFKIDKIKFFINRFFTFMHIDIEIQKHNIIHLFFIPISSMTFFFYSMSILPLMSKMIDDIFISKAILKYSYYPNKSCNNISYGTYIKLIGANKVSETNINNFDNILLSYGISNKKITFETKICDKIK